MENIHSRLRAFRKLKSCTQEELAIRMGISVSIIGELERGVREPSHTLLELYCQALNIDIDELIGEKGGK